jgi:DNA-binding transcriptional MerR regulator
MSAPNTQTWRHYSPAEVTRLLGVSPKALRLYESRGLIKAVRTANGWRAFGRVEIERLHLVLALKALRLPLSRIGELLAAGRVGLAEVLAVHERALIADAAKAERALRLVREARSRLARGETLSLDDIATLAKETPMSFKSGQKELGALLEPHVRAHFSDADIAATQARDFDQEQIGKEWDALIAAARALMAADDWQSERAKDLGRRWKAEVAKFTQSDQALADKVYGVWQDAMADPKAAPQLPLDPAIFAFVGKIFAAG